MKAKVDQRRHTELIPWPFVERCSRKGYLTRDFYIAGRHYRWLSNGVSPQGLVRYGAMTGQLP